MNRTTNMNATPKVSVVIPAHNAARSIVACIEALQNQTEAEWIDEIIVVDDGSTDNTAELAEKAGAIVLKQAQAGAGAARNYGVAQAKNELICFTDADCLAEKDWLVEILAPLKDADLIGCKGIYRTEQKELTARFIQIEYEEKYDHLEKEEWINFIDFYGAAFRKSILLANDGFDPRFPIAEDRELSYRLAVHGYKMGFQPTAVVTHYHSRTPWNYFRKKMRSGYWTSQVVRRFPTHSTQESYTPQTVKIQILLMALFLLSLPLLLFSLKLLIAPLGIAALFGFTTLSYIREAWKKDRAVALVSPYYLSLRALALGLGYAFGLLFPMKEDEQLVTISGGAYLAKRTIDMLVGAIGFLLLLLSLPYLLTKGRWTTKAVVGQHGQPFQLLFFPEPNGRFTPLLQSYHLLTGKMSLVGPKPISDPSLDYADEERARFLLKPGLIAPDCSDQSYISTYSWSADWQIIRTYWRRK